MLARRRGAFRRFLAPSTTSPFFFSGSTCPPSFWPFKRAWV